MNVVGSPAEQATPLFNRTTSMKVKKAHECALKFLLVLFPLSLNVELIQVQVDRHDF